MFSKPQNHIQITVDIFVANNHGDQNYSKSYQIDSNTSLKALGIVWNGITHP